MDSQRKKTIWRSAIGGGIVSLAFIFVISDMLGIDDSMSLPTRLLCAAGVGIVIGTLWIGIEKLLRARTRIQ